MIGIVVIGRNEGDRLRRCLESLRDFNGRVVYVDSGSTDASVAFSRAMGIEVVELATDVPFTAGRARNEGARRLLRLRPDVAYIQFVDGDCEIIETWFSAAAGFLDQHADAAVVCGRRRERFPGASIYNHLCDMEWDSPIGEAGACGGDSMMRAAAFSEVGGFAPEVICGEEPELCVRLRAAGWKIFRIDQEMTLHDAAMTRFSQWWRRMLRGGFAYALGAWMHGRQHGHWVRESFRIWTWGLIVPATAIGLAPFTHDFSLLMFAAYPLLGIRAAQWRRSRGNSAREAMLYGAFCVLGKWPELLGQLKFLLSRAISSQGRIIEYKSASTATQHPV